MTIYSTDIDKIYFSKTKNYFKEVLSSYGNENYRSAIVMLYSVVICDLLFKLEELRDMYNDRVAENVLNKIKSSELHKNNFSSWENELIKAVTKQTAFIGKEEKALLDSLKEYRNLSAHPSLNGDFELITPSKEITLALIKGIHEKFLIKPPIFINDIVGVLSDDLDRNRMDFEADNTLLDNS